MNIEWSSVPSELDQRLRDAGRLAAVLSPHLTVEEAYLLAKYAREIDNRALLAVGPVPVEGEDETFPGGFTIRAEKCPNRRGVEAVASHFAGELITFEQLLRQLGPQGIQAVWFSGGYGTDWNDQQTVEALRAVPLVIVQDLFASPVWEGATYQLPGAAFAERDGSYVNQTHRLQSFSWAVRPPSGVMVEGQLYWQLLGQAGMYNARRTLDDVAREIVDFSAATGPVPEVGIDLRMNQIV